MTERKLFAVAKKIKNKLATTGAIVRERELEPGERAVDQLYKAYSMFNYNLKQLRSVPLLGNNYSHSQARQAMVSNLVYDSKAFVLDQGRELGQKILKFNFNIKVASANTQPFVEYLQVGERGVLASPADMIRNMIGLHYDMPMDLVRVYVNGVLIAGNLESIEVEEARKLTGQSA
jgi:hypothetical protein